MFCPRCGQEQISSETRFCSRCGFLMTGVSELILRDGALPETYVKTKGDSNSPKKMGIKKGAMIMLVGTFLIVPLLAVISAELNITPVFVAITAILSFIGGLLRIIYAIMFESSLPSDKSLESDVYETGQKLLNKSQNRNALPPEQFIPATDYVPPTAGNWRDTNDLQPSTVTENTTKLLEQEK